MMASPLYKLMLGIAFCAFVLHGHATDIHFNTTNSANERAYGPQSIPGTDSGVQISREKLNRNDPATLAAFTSYIESTNIRDRLFVIRTCIQMNHKEMYFSVRNRALSDSESEVRAETFVAAGVFFDNGPETSKAAINEIRSHRSGPAVNAAAKYCSRRQIPEAIPALFELLTSDNSGLRLLAARALVHYPEFPESTLLSAAQGLALLKKDKEHIEAVYKSLEIERPPETVNEIAVLSKRLEVTAAASQRSGGQAEIKGGAEDVIAQTPKVLVLKSWTKFIAICVEGVICLWLTIRFASGIKSIENIGIRILVAPPAFCGVLGFLFLLGTGSWNGLDLAALTILTALLGMMLFIIWTAAPIARSLSGRAGVGAIYGIVCMFIGALCFCLPTWIFEEHSSFRSQFIVPLGWISILGMPVAAFCGVMFSTACKKSLSSHGMERPE